VRPVETYHVGPSDDPAVLKLAGSENRESGYSLGAYRQLLEKIYIDERRGESKAFAAAINTELYRALSAVNPGLANRGVKMAPFAVLVGTEMPAILVEVSCLSNEKEAQLLTTDDYRARIAAALLEGIRSYSRQLDGVAKKEG
jgi:N-acetylmuramoyl-L-alanine amidase